MPNGVSSASAKDNEKSGGTVYASPLFARNRRPCGTGAAPQGKKRGAPLARLPGNNTHMTPVRRLTDAREMTVEILVDDRTQQLVARDIRIARKIHHHDARTTGMRFEIVAGGGIERPCVPIFILSRLMLTSTILSSP